MIRDWKDSLSRDYFGEFKGRGVIVAGGASGIGAALVDALHWLGAQVAIVDKGADAAQKLTAALSVRGAAPSVIAADLSVEADRQRALTQAGKAVGGASYFISTLGYDARMSFATVTQGEIETFQRINFIAPLLAARDVLPIMRLTGGGAVCLFTSRHGSEIAEPDMAGYGCAKAALDSGIKRLAVYAGEGNKPDNIVRVFGFCPGWVQTESQTARFSQAQFRSAAAEQLVPVPMRPEDVVPAVIFALSRHAGLLSGTILRHDGGEGQIKSNAVSGGSRSGA